VTRSGRASVWRLVGLLAGIGLLAALSPVLHLGPRLVALRAWILSLGPLGPVVYTLIYAVAVLFVVPASAMSAAAGGLFGPAVGLAVVVVASNLGSAMAFLVARYVARDSVAALVAEREGFRRIDALVAERGALAVAFVRLVPIFPFDLASYAFGLTGVPFPTYVLWTFIASFPGAVLFVVGSAGVFEVLASGRVPFGLVAAFVLALAVVLLLARLVGRELRR
jgi:uncharacterized membrane protein YdjX (TVP38/TMEM64 family)